MSVRILCATIVSLVSVQNIQQLYSVMASAMNEEVSALHMSHEEYLLNALFI